MVYFELRGNGLSSRPADESRMTIEVMAHDLEHLRKHLGIESVPVLFGHSNGACISLIYAALYPERVDKLIVMAAEINNNTPNNTSARFASVRKDDPVYGPALATLMGVVANPPQTDDEFIQALENCCPTISATTARRLSWRTA